MGSQSAFTAGTTTDRRDGWTDLTRVVAAGAVTVTGMRTTLTSGVTTGLLVAVALLPVWITYLRRYRGARLLVGLGLGALVSGAILTQMARADHQTSTSLGVSTSVLMLSLLAGVCLLLWARTVLKDATVAALFGLGMTLGISSGSSLFSSNPWRFGFATPLTVLFLALAWRAGRRYAEITVVLALTVTSTLTDARSSFAILLLTAVLVGWQMRPSNPSRRGSAARSIVGIAAIAVVVYNLGEALILDGYLGQSTQARSLAQVEQSGSLIVGGRPELSATRALFLHQPWGFGSGVLPNLSDIQVAKNGFRDIGYDPNNGYVERFMFGTGYELHSTIGDLWVHYGFMGLVFAVALTLFALKGLGRGLANRTASALLIFLAFKTLWNLPFAPFYSSVPLMMLFLALAIPLRSGSGRADQDEPSPADLVVTRS